LCNRATGSPAEIKQPTNSLFQEALMIQSAKELIGLTPQNALATDLVIELDGVVSEEIGGG
jgi:hypothetical protein